MLGALAGQMLLTCGHTPVSQEVRKNSATSWTKELIKPDAAGGSLKGGLLIVAFLYLLPFVGVSPFVLTSLKTWSGCRRAPETREEMPCGKRLGLTCVTLQKSSGN